MPSLINNEGNLTDVAANYRKSFAPFTLFGTRQLRFYNIYIYNLNLVHQDNGGDQGQANSYEAETGGPAGWAGAAFTPNFDVDSIFARVVSAVQTQAEVYGVWRPEYNGAPFGGDPTDDSWFTVMVAGDTHADTDWDQQFGTNSATLGDTIYNALYGTSCSGVDVYQAYISGDTMDRDTGTSLAKGANKVALSSEQQAKVDALKAARAALRPTK